MEQQSAESLVTFVPNTGGTESDVNVCDSESDTLTEDAELLSSHDIKDLDSQASSCTRRSMRSGVRKQDEANTEEKKEDEGIYLHRVRTQYGKPGKVWNSTFHFSRS